MRYSSKIDVHHHVYPPTFTKALEDHGGDPSGWWVPSWTIDSDHDLCREMGVGTAILSVTAPGAMIEKDLHEARKLARSFNDFTAQLRDAEPKKYGFFASVPSLLDMEGALEEIRYALDTLHADGVILMTRYGDHSQYLGHEDFHPIWDELNTRRAVVFVHPTHPVDTNLFNKYIPQPAWDYPHETGRTAIDMIISGTLQDHAKDCKIILSHAGGDLPYLIDRPAALLPHSPPKYNPGKSREEMVEGARSLYYDTALSSSPMHLKALMELLKDGKEDHVLFGTDYPDAPLGGIEYVTSQLEGTKELDVAKLRDNALKMFPRLVD